MVITMQSEKEGFEVVVQNPDFKCAFITASPQYAYGKVNALKRHNDSDEVFVLLSGNAVLLTKDDADTHYQTTSLRLKTAHNVTKGTWHHLAVSADAVVFVAESGSMKRENTQTVHIDADDIYIYAAPNDPVGTDRTD